MKKILIIFLPIIPFLLIILEVFLSFKIGKISFLEPIRILLANFSENANFKFMNSALLGLFVSSALIAFYSIIVFRFIKMSILLPCKYYFGSHSNSNILLRKKLHNLSGINIFEIFSFYIFAYKITNTKDFAIKDEELELASLNKKWYHKFSQLNVILKRHIGDENFSKNIEIKEKEYIQFAINKAKLTTNEVIKRFGNIETEIQKLFSHQDFEAGIHIKSQSFHVIEVLIFNKNTLWPNRALNLKNISLQKGELLLGYFQKIKNGVHNYDYIITSKSLNHSVISASSRSGKDVMVANLIFSILYNIKKYKNMEIHFFDTKGVDASYLNNLKSYGIYRHKDITQYSQILKNLVQEMRNNSHIIENFSNIYNYNESNPQKAIKEKFIIVNEFLSLNNSLNAKDLHDVLNSLITLTSEGAGFGYKVILMSQTIRKDSSTALASMLANIKSRFLLKAIQSEEARINTRGLSDEDASRIMNMKLYNCFHVEDNEIKQEFKAYLLTQDDIRTFIQENFERQNIENLSDKIQDYYNFAKENNKISFKEATEIFSLSRSEWDKFIKQLEENHEIERLANNSIIWKKNNF